MLGPLEAFDNHPHPTWKPQHTSPEALSRGGCTLRTLVLRITLRGYGFAPRGRALAPSLNYPPPDSCILNPVRLSPDNLTSAGREGAIVLASFFHLFLVSGADLWFWIGSPFVGVGLRKSGPLIRFSGAQNFGVRISDFFLPPPVSLSSSLYSPRCPVRKF